MKTRWTRRPLGDVCEVVNGGTPKTGIPRYWDGKHLWITPAEMGKRHSPYVDDTERRLTDLGLRDSSAKLLPPTSIILSSRAPIGHLVINTEPMATNQGCKGLVPGKEIHHKFLFYYLSSIIQLLNSLGTGATFKELSAGKLKEVTIPIAPLAEQHRIVDILDEAVDGIAAARGITEENYRNARALFEGHLQSTFSRQGREWVERPLRHFAHAVSTGPFGSMLHKSDYVSEGVPLINPINIVNGTISPDETKLIGPRTRERLIAYLLKEGDIVIGRRGEIGRCAVVGSKEAGWICGTGCFFVRPLPSVNSHFLASLLRSSDYRDRLERVATGTTMKNLSNRALGDLVVAIPSHSEQSAIISRADSMSAETGRLESLYQRKLAALDELKSSLLHQAFTGAL